VAKNASSILIRDTHRREYNRTMWKIGFGSVVLWFILVICLNGTGNGGSIVTMSVVLAVGLVITRVALWLRYRRDMRADLDSHPSN
jgi:hypothetical protein